MPLIPFWLLQSRRGPLVMRIASKLAPVVAMLAVLFMVRQTEMMFFPVIKDWRMESITRDGNRFVVNGSMRKARPCELVNTSVVAVMSNPLFPSRLLYQIAPEEILGGNSPVGLHTWGPWSMPIPPEFLKYREHIDHIEIVGHHRCHLLWNQETIYGQIPVEQIP
jgi:hypothetical protein